MTGPDPAPPSGPPAYSGGSEPSSDAAQAALHDPTWAADLAIVRRATAHNFGQVIYGAVITQPDDTTHLILTMSSWPRADEARLALLGDEVCAAVDGVTLDIRRHHDYRAQPEPLPWWRCAHCGRTDNSDVT